MPTHEQRVQFSTLTHFLECLRVMWASHPMRLCVLGPQPTLPSSLLLSASFTVLPITPFMAFKWSSRTSRQESCLCLLCA